MVLNIAEASGRTGRDQVNRFRIARGSALEVHAGLELAQAWGYAGSLDVELALLDRIGGMLYSLSR